MTSAAVANALDGLLIADLGDFETLEQFELTGDITVVHANEWVETRESIAVGDSAKSFNTRYRFTDPILSSIILRKTKTMTNPEGRIDFNATIVAGRELQVQIADQWYDISDFVVQALKQSSPSLAHTSAETILHVLRQYGWDPAARLPMYLQHLGAGLEAFDLIAVDFADLGAVNNTDEVSNRAKGKKSQVLQSFRHREGVPLTSMEISKANRSLSQTGAGFIGFLDGSWNTLQKILTMHRTRLALQQVITSDSATEDQKAEAAARQTRIRDIFTVQTRARAFRNWGGTSEVKDPLDDNAPSEFYAQQVPCGRLTVMGNHVYSVWTTSAQPSILPSVGALPEIEASGPDTY